MRAAFVSVDATVGDMLVSLVVAAVLAAEEEAGAGPAENEVSSGDVEASHLWIKPLASLGRLT